MSAPTTFIDQMIVLPCKRKRDDTHDQAADRCENEICNSKSTCLVASANGSANQACRSRWLPGAGAPFDCSVRLAAPARIPFGDGDITAIY